MDGRLTFFLSHSKEQNDSTEDVDGTDDTRGNHVGFSLSGGKKGDSTVKG